MHIRRQRKQPIRLRAVAFAIGFKTSKKTITTAKEAKRIKKAILERAKESRTAILIPLHTHPQ